MHSVLRIEGIKQKQEPETGRNRLALSVQNW